MLAREWFEENRHFRTTAFAARRRGALMQADATRRVAIAALGNRLGLTCRNGCSRSPRSNGRSPAPPAACRRLADSGIECSSSISLPARRRVLAPILIWVRGGGFTQGKKEARQPSVDHSESAAGRRAGLLRRRHQLPSRRPGASGRAAPEDVALAVEWLRANAAARSADPERQFFWRHVGRRRSYRHPSRQGTVVAVRVRHPSFPASTASRRSMSGWATRECRASPAAHAARDHGRDRGCRCSLPARSLIRQRFQAEFRS